MIYTNEIRIGNIVQDAISLEKWLVVLKLEQGVITCGDEEFNYPYLAESLQPIPLTPEILEKAGFVEQLIDGMDVYTIRLENQFYNGLEYVGCEMQWHDDGSIFLADKESGTRIPGRISTLHRLQNLYFALTGEELNIAL